MKEPEQQQVLTANAKSNEPPPLSAQEKDSNQYKTQSQNRTRRETCQLQSGNVSLTSLKEEKNTRKQKETRRFRKKLKVVKQKLKNLISDPQKQQKRPAEKKQMIAELADKNPTNAAKLW